MIYKSEKLRIEKDGVKLYLSYTDCHNIANIIIDYMAEDMAKFMALHRNEDYKPEQCHLSDVRDRINSRFEDLEGLYNVLNKNRELK